MTQRHEVSSKHVWENDANSLAQHRVDTNLGFIKKKKKEEEEIFSKCNKTKYACMLSQQRCIVCLLYCVWSSQRLKDS